MTDRALRWGTAAGALLAAVLWVPFLALGPSRWARIGHGQLFGDFQTIYLRQAEALSSDPVHVVPGWLYPPPLAVMLRPVAAAGEPTAILVWWGVLGLSIAAVGAATRRALGGTATWPLVAVLLALSAPVLDAVKWGQVSLPLAAIGLVALRVDGRAGAALIGFAGAIKVYPLGWLLPALLRRRWREVGLGVVVAAAVLIAATATLSLDVATQMYGAIWFEAGGKDYGPWGGQDLASLSRRLWVRGTVLDYRHPGPLVWPMPVGISPRVADGVFRVVALVPLAITAWRVRRGADPWAVLPALALASPPGWTHAFAFLPAIFGAGIARGGLSRGVAAAGVAVGATPLVGLLLGPTGWNAATAWGATSVAALLGWLALLVPARALRVTG